MNDLDTIDHLGPAPTPLSSAALAEARTRLDEAIASSEGGVGSRPRKRLPLLVAAATVAVGLAVTPALVGGNDSVALAAVDPMTFPWTPGAIPSDLGDPVFEKDLNFAAARYGEGTNAIDVTTEVADQDFWTIPADAESVDVNGDDAQIYERIVHHGSTTSTPAVTIVWEDDAHGWTGVTGEGTHADQDRVIAFAKSLRDEPQRVALTLDLAPEGWAVASYKEDRILTLSETGKPDVEDLSVVIIDRLAADLAAYGATNEQAVTINGRPALLGQQSADGGGSRWVLEAETATGQTFFLQAPDSFSKEQIVEVAESVTYEP